MLAQRRQRARLETIEAVWRAVLEGKIRDEAVADVLLLLADHAPEFDRERRRDWNRARDGFVIVRHLGRPGRTENAADHIASVIAAHAGHDRIEVLRLAQQCAVRQVAQIEPHGDRKPSQQHDDEQDQQEPA